MLSLRTESNVGGDPAAEDAATEFYDGAGRVRLARGYMPGRTDRFSAQKFFYDERGLLVKQSKPTEALADWSAAGDDAAGGWVLTEQEYDWQGRPTVSTRADGFTSEVAYGGCGCAGGAVTTVRDEAGRRRKLYRDPLGRLVKVEEMKWQSDGGGVYAMTTYEYNGRDQLTRVAQQGQERIFQYDGHGRLWKRTTPEQGTAEFAYNRNDTPAWTRDARGVKTVYAHTPRHLLDSVSYDLTGVAAGQGVAATANVSFEYDAAGNRTRMTDGLGSVEYAYDAASRVTRETRTFSGVGSFNLTYAYNRAGLASVTNHWGARVSYQTDFTGAVTSVTGSDTPVYAQNLQYRAFGVLKALTYGNARRLALSYDERMRLKRWEVEGVMGSAYGYDDFDEHTGRVTSAGNLYDPTLDRSYKYDHVGRLVEARSGGEVDNHLDPDRPAGAADGPYSLTYTYDAFGNQTSRSGRGGLNPNVASTFTNNRRDGWAYDLSGNLRAAGAHQFAYDAPGRQVSASSLVRSGYDGDRLRAKKVESGVTTYYLRSTVLGGQIVSELRLSAGAWEQSRGYIYLGANLLAIKEGGQVSYSHDDPVSKDRRLTGAAGQVTSAVVTDPFGGEVKSAAWSLNPSRQPRKFTTYGRDSDASDEAGHRRYRPSWGRFDQPDPADFSYDPADPQSLNRYAYVSNDPVNFTDPSGLMPEMVPCYFIGQGGNTLEGAWALCEYNPHAPRGVGGPLVINDRPGGDGAQNPGHTPTPDVTAIGDLLNQMLSDAACGGFVNALYRQVAADNPRSAPNTETILDLFKKITGPDQGGIVRRHPLIISGKPANGTVSGSLESYNATIILGGVVLHGGSPNPTAEEISKRVTAYDAAVTLHELFHLAGKNYGYSDRQMAVAVFKMMTPQMQAQSPLPDPNDAFTNSGYWNRELWDRCLP